jgi:hypothetical protein
VIVQPALAQNLHMCKFVELEKPGNTHASGSESVG